MTPEQVSALSDTELNLAMIWLYPPVKSVFITILGNYAVDSKIVNYLTDYNITMPLVIEKSVSLSIEMSCEKPVIALCEEFSSHDKSLLRAACECLVLIALDKKKPTTQTPQQIG